MKTTKKQGSVLEDHKLKFEITPVDKKKLKVVPPSFSERSLPRPKRIRRPGIVRTYFGCMIEVILA